MATHEGFEHAARFDAELTDRQREVLRLIAGGRTNGEIADALGMSLAGAKWHVSEVLTKLALPSREAAAEYYRWRETPRRRIERLARALAPAAWVKLGIGAVGAAAAGVVVFVVSGAFQGEAPAVGPAAPGLPFSMESAYTRTTDHTALKAGRRYWYESPARTRTDIDEPVVTRADPGFELEFDRGTTTILVDQGQRTYSDARSFWVAPFAAFDAVEPTMSATLGPLPYRSLDDAIANLSGSGNPNTPIETRRIGSARVAGLLAEGVEFVVHRTEPETFSYTLWIDPDRMLLLKRDTSYSVADGSGDGTVHEVEEATRLTYGRVDPSKFVVTSAPGATFISCKAIAVQPNASFGKPFVAIPPSALPEGLRPLSWGVSANRAGDCDSATASYIRESEATGPVVLFLSEHMTVPDGFFEGTQPIRAGGRDVASTSDIGGNRYYRFLAHDVAIELRTDSLSEEEVLAIVQAMID